MNLTRARSPALRLAACLLACAAGLGCSRAPKLKSYDLVVRVESDPGQPLAGAKLLHAATALGISGADGRVLVRATGNEGEHIELEVACPVGYRSPEEPLGVTLRRATRAGERPEYFAACRPSKRKLVVAVRLEHGANIPIRYLGKEQGRSDSSGVAHLFLEEESDKTIELTLDTSEQPRLRPKSPSARFRIGSGDDVVALTQAFQLSAPKRVSTVHAAGPQRIR